MTWNSSTHPEVGYNLIETSILDWLLLRLLLGVHACWIVADLDFSLNSVLIIATTVLCPYEVLSAGIHRLYDRLAICDYGLRSESQVAN